MSDKASEKTQADDYLPGAGSFTLGDREDVEGMVDPEEKIPPGFVFHSTLRELQADTSLNLSSVDPSGFRDLITSLGGVPPLSPLSQTTTYYSGTESETVSSEDYSTADSSWQSLQSGSDPGVEFGQRGSGDGIDAQELHQNKGARPKTKQRIITREMRKKKKAELRKCENKDEQELLSELQNFALGEMKREAPPSGTGLYYHEIMAKHKNEWDPNYPEGPERITQPFARCKELGLVDRCVHLEQTYSTEDQIGYSHNEEYIEKVKTSVHMSAEELRAFSRQYDSVYFNNISYECALVAVGGLVDMTKQIIQGKIKNGFALVRPPGHHAAEGEACGYCVFNNVAIVAKMAIEEMGLKRILIVDWDVHHGQGTQNMFYNDPRVLYFSIHRYEYGSFWPNLRLSDYDYTGEGKGRGYNINVPLNKKGMTNSDYLAILQQVLMPVAYEYSPQLVLVSSGYDAALGCPEFCPELIVVSCGMDCAVEDPKGEMEVTPACFPHLLHMVSSLAEGRVCVALEGGYCIPSLAEGVALTLRELLGDPCPLIGRTQEPCQSVIESILNVIKVLRPYWNCLKYQTGSSTDDVCPYPEVNQSPPRAGITFSTPENRPEQYVEDDYLRKTPAEKESLGARINKLIESTSLIKADKRTCLVFDSDMRAHKNAVSTSHPERPDRISRIFDLHVDWGLYEKCLKIKAREATIDELFWIHEADYVYGMLDMASVSPRDLYKLQDSYNSVYLCQASYHCAALATGGTLNVVEAVLSGKAQNGVAIIRPPGHHAEAHTAMGFCFFNTVAVAAKYAQIQFGLKRVLILDWDVHHGNGTQHVFDSDPSVLFVSLHRFDHGYFYPSSDDANYDIVGFDKGEGYNVNIPWNNTSMGDAEYIAAFQQVVMPIAYEYDPELVLVSAGFDAARGDPLGGYKISPAGYAHMTHMLMSLANGKVILALEGGYNLHSISTSMASCTCVLLGESCPKLPPLVPCDSAVHSINQVLQTHKKYWKCLKFAVPLPPAQEQSEDKSPSHRHRETTDDSIAETSRESDGLSEHLTDHSVSNLSNDVYKMSLQRPGFEGFTDDLSDKSQSSQEVNTSASSATGDFAGACGGSDSAGGLLESLSLQGYDQMYAVEPATWCPHLQTISCLPDGGLNTSDPCEQCGHVGENWVCLICYKVLCSRFVNEHMLFHGMCEAHLMVLSYADLSVWCYGCDTYVDNPVFFSAKNSAHLSKFGTPLMPLANT